MKNILFILMLFLLSGTVFPQSSDSTGRVGDSYIINVNRYSLPIKNNGSIAYNDSGQLNGDKIIISGGFSLAGKENNQIWVSMQLLSLLVLDYLPGAITDPQNMSKDIFVVRKSDPPFGKSWHDWEDAVQFGAMFYDGDSDGVYNPVDKNSDGVWNANEDMPFLLGDVTAWNVYNDGVPVNQRRFWGTHPMGIEIRQTTFAGNTYFMENTVFIMYTIVNTGLITDSLSDVYFSIWTDPDIGDKTDDLTGCDTILFTGYAYNSGPDNELGDQPPAVFFTYLQGPLVDSSSAGNPKGRNYLGENYGKHLYPGKLNLGMTSFQNFASPYGFEMESPNRLFNRVRGLDVDDGLIDPCTLFGGIVVPDTICDQVNPLFMFSGDPVAGTGWMDILQIDKRLLVNTGPFNLMKNEPQNIIVAYSAVRGNDALDAVRRGKILLPEVIREYDSNFVSLTYEAVPSSTPSSNQLTYYKLYQNYPNPFNPTTTIRYEIPQDGFVTIEVFDVLGQKIRTLVNKFQKADSYEVDFSGSALAGGIYIYRMKVNDFITSKKMVLIK